MNFFKKLFQQQPKQPGEYVDTNGIYMHVQCSKCSNVMRLRADKQHDLNRADGGYEWHKTIVCDKCFQKMSTVVRFDSKHNITTQDIQKGKYVSAPAE